MTWKAVSRDLCCAVYHHAGSMSVESNTDNLGLSKARITVLCCGVLLRPLSHLEASVCGNDKPVKASQRHWALLGPLP